MAICRRYEDSERRSNNYFDKLEKLSVYGFAKFNEELAEKRVYSQHNLVSDTSFNEFNPILYRNVLIYFDNDLQKKVFNLLDESLSLLGFLALGTKETIKYSIWFCHRNCGASKEC